MSSFIDVKQIWDMFLHLLITDSFRKLSPKISSKCFEEELNSGLRLPDECPQ
jgi:hypothetical protein